MTRVPFSERNPYLWLCRHCGSSLLMPSRCMVCDGNVARAERLKLTLGTRIHYFGTARSVGRDWWIGVSLRFSALMDDRTIPGRKHYFAAGQNWVDAGYCLDAPDLIPAGGCQSTRVPDIPEDEDPYVPEQIAIAREPLYSA